MDHFVNFKKELIDLRINGSESRKDLEIHAVHRRSPIAGHKLRVAGAVLQCIQFLLNITRAILTNHENFHSAK